MMEKENKEPLTLEKLKSGSIITVYFNDDNMREPKIQKFKFIGLQGNEKIVNKSKGRSGFVLLCEPITIKPVIEGVPEALFPENIIIIETDYENVEN